MSAAAAMSLSEGIRQRAFFSLAKALAARNRLTFDTEELLNGIREALGLAEDVALTLTEQAEQDPEASMLKNWQVQQEEAGLSMSNASHMMPSMKAAPSRAMPMQIATSYDLSYGQPPAAKKQKKASQSVSRPTLQSPPATGGGKLGGGGSKSARAKSMPSTPVGGIASSGQGFRTQPKPFISSRPIISAINFQKVTAGNSQAEMEAYLVELNLREREIFTKLIEMGVDESDPQLKDLHRALLQWYKLDARQHQLATLLLTATN